MNFSIKSVFVAGVLGLTASTAVAQSQSLTCAEVNGTVIPGGYTDRAGIVIVEMALETGDMLSVAVNSDVTQTRVSGLTTPISSYQINFYGPDFKERVDLPFSRTIAKSGIYGLFGLGGSYDLRQTATAAPLTATISCTPGSGGDGALQFAAASRQNSTILNGLSQAAGGRDGDGGVQATQAGLSFNTGNTGDWYVWGYTQWQTYSDAGTGTSLGAVVGADRDVGGARLGVVLAYDDTSIDFGSGDESVRSFAIGPYVTGSYDGVDYDAYVTFAQPDYDTPSGSYETDRVSFGIAIDGNVAMANGANLSPFLRFTGASEDVPVVGVNPADTIKTNQVALGARYDFVALDNGLAPYLSLAYEANRQDSTAGGEVTYQAARYGVGFAYETNGGGTIRFDLTAGESGVDLRDIGVRLGYSANF